MWQLIYTSTAMTPCTTESLGDILIQSRARNLACHVTGMLLYDYGNFLQVLEGPKEAVDELFAAILRDPRHSNILTLAYDPISIREFESWSMAFWDLAPVSSSAGAAPSIREIMTVSDCAFKAKCYLRDFQGHI